MNVILPEEYWSSRFEVTQGDLDRVAQRLEHAGPPQDLKAIALPIILGRLEHGHDPGPPAPVDLAGEPAVRVWDPASSWQVDDAVLLVHDRFGNSKYEVFLGEITQVDQDAVEIKIGELQITKIFQTMRPGIVVQDWQNLISELVGKKLGSEDLKERADGILIQHGEHILAGLAGALRHDPRFTTLEGKWSVFHSLPHIEKESLQAIHHYLLQNGPASLEELLPVVKERLVADFSLFKMAIHAALQSAPDRFENTGTSLHPRWKARLPAPDQAEVTHFAFDPQTFELLCRPGQRLTQKKARRLQELELYAHVVTFPEWQMPAHPG